MKVVIAIDSFKGSMSSSLACETVKRAVFDVFGDIEIITVPIADGGEGTVDSICNKKVSVLTTGPLGEKIVAEYGVYDEKTAVIEIAAAAGLTLVPEDKRNPLYTTTYGVGELILDAIEKGCRNFIIGLGGSATNDGGVGMLSALGFKFMDENGNKIKLGSIGLKSLKVIDDSEVDPRIFECKFNVACDVTNPLCGESGCSRIFAPQKGADFAQINLMDSWLDNFAKVVKLKFDRADPAFPGAGAAGGLGFAFLSFLKASLNPGIDIIIKHTKLEDKVVGADFVITGEGQIDGQTAMGKTPVGVARVCKKHKIPTIAFCGCVGVGAEVCNQNGIDAFFPILNKITTLDSALKTENAVDNLYKNAKQVLLLIKTIKKV